MIITWPYRLRKGHSNDPSAGACAMDAVNWLEHGRHGDEPECASPVITNFVIPANDAMDDITRQRLLPYLHRIAGSRSPEHEAARLRVVVLAAARVFAPIALECAGLDASVLRAISDDAPYSDIDTAAASAARILVGAQARSAVAAVAARRAVDAAASAAWNAVHTPVWAARYAVDVAVWAARSAVDAAVCAAVWDAYFSVLDEALWAGPQGEPWSADAVDVAVTAYCAAGGGDVLSATWPRNKKSPASA